MKTYEIEVNGKKYAVKVKEIDEAAFNATSQSNQQAKVPDNVPATTDSVTNRTDTLVTAPLPGRILSVVVAIGQTVKAGDILCVLEAMKMENEVVAPEDGTIHEIRILEGSTVETGDVLVVM